MMEAKPSDTVSIEKANIIRLLGISKKLYGVSDSLERFLTTCIALADSLPEYQANRAMSMCLEIARFTTMHLKNLSSDLIESLPR